MKTIRLSFIAVCFSILFAAASVHAQATRTWVSGVGDDANPCSRTAPCKTFAGAISKTAAGGEISALDPGGFGVVTITKSITINGDGTLAGILAAGSNGIIVNAAAADKVVIRNISINGAGTGLNGIRYLAGSQLTVENVTISGFTGFGIDVSLAGSGNLFVIDSSITKCANGIRVTTSASFAKASLDNVRLLQMTNGLEVTATLTGNSNANVSRSFLMLNSGNAIFASSGGGLINVSDSVISSGGTAVNTTGGTIRLASNRIFNNAISIAITGGTVSSDGANRLAGNTGGVAPNGPAITLQ